MGESLQLTHPIEASHWARLIGRIAQTDRHALAELYDASSSQVFGLVLRLVGDRAAAEEIALDVYTQVWKRASQYDPSRGSASSWLLLIARSRAIDHLRSSVRKTRDAERPLDPAVAQVSDHSANPEEVVLLQGRRQLVRSALESLDSRKREAIDLAFYSGLTHTEIADRLGLPVGTVKTRIRSGMIRLRELLEPFAGESL